MVKAKDLAARLPQPTEALEFVAVEGEKVNVTAYHRQVGAGDKAEILLSEYVLPLDGGRGDVWIMGLPPGADVPNAVVLVNRPAASTATLVGQLLSGTGKGLAGGNLSVHAGESATGTKGWVAVYPAATRANALRQLLGMPPVQTQEFFLANQWNDIGNQAKLPMNFWRAAGMLVKRVADQLTALVGKMSAAMEQGAERSVAPERKPDMAPEQTTERELG